MIALPTLAAALLLLATQTRTDPAPTWRTAAPLVHARSAHNLVGDGTTLFALAGTGADDGEHTAPVLEVERFDGQQWRVETKLPGDGLNAPASVLVGQRLFVIGGFNLLTNVPTAQVRVYDLGTHAWSEAAPLPAPRGGHAAVVLDGRIHVLGGGNSVSTLADHDEYDPATNAWTKRAPLPRSQGSPAAVAFEGKLWSIGGRSGPKDFGAVDVWDPAGDTWSAGPAIDPRGTAGAVVYRGTIWVFGGESQARGACLDEVLRLDRVTNTWSVAAHLPTARNYARAALLRDEVCIAGGSLSAGFSHAAKGSRAVECLHVPQAAKTAAAHDAVLGRWLGSAGTAPNDSVFGLEIEADGNGALRGTVTLVELNYFGAPLPSFVAAGERTYRVPEFGIELVLDGDRLHGTLGGSAPVELHRTRTLPTEAPLPRDLPPGPAPRWELDLAAPVWAAPATRDGFAYVGTSGGVFHAVRVADGSLAWTFPAGRPMFGEALASDDALYFVCDNGFLFKLERASGRELWRYDLGDAQVPRILPHRQVFDYDHLAPAPVLEGGVVYVGSGDGSFHAVDAATGARVWRRESKGKIRSSAAIQGERVVFGTLDGEVELLERANGTPVWKRSVQAPVTSSFAFLGDKLLVGTRGSILAGLDPASGATQWRLSMWGSWVESTPVDCGNGLACVGSSDLRRVVCFDPRDGRVAWRRDVFGWCWGRPLVHGETIYVATGGVEPYEIRHVAGLLALDRASGAIRWRREVPRPAHGLHWGYAAGAALDGDTLVIGGLDGLLQGFPAG